MSLTNDQITAKNFQEFYAQIRPYLNGQVPPVFNKFSKSDLYSANEKIIGRWTDGKPIYQRVIPFTGSGRSVNIETLTNVDSIVELRGIVIESNSIVNVNNYKSRLYYNNSTGLLQFQGDTGWNAFTAYAIIQYTKTSDSPVSVGNDTDYSTTEKIVGTWIDGKPLYQKTIIGLDVTPAYNAWTNIIDASSLSIETFKVVSILCTSTGELRNDITNLGVEVMYNGQTGYIQAEYNSNVLRRSFNCITIQYTKTTD